MLAIDYHQDEADRYDCMECGNRQSVHIIEDRGFCSTPGCLSNDPVQFVYLPHWSKPKACHADREITLK